MLSPWCLLIATRAIGPVANAVDPVRAADRPRTDSLKYLSILRPQWPA